MVINKKAMTFLAKLIVFTILLGILVLSVLIIVGTNQVEGISNFFAERFFRIVNVNILGNLPKM